MFLNFYLSCMQLVEDFLSSKELFHKGHLVSLFVLNVIVLFVKGKVIYQRKKHADGCTRTSSNSQVVVVYQWKGVLFDGCPTSSSSSLFESTKREQQQQQQKQFSCSCSCSKNSRHGCYSCSLPHSRCSSSFKSNSPSSYCCSSLLETTTRTTTDNSTTTTTTTTIEMEEEKAAAGTAAAAAGTAAAAAGGKREGNNSVSSLRLMLNMNLSEKGMFLPYALRTTNSVENGGGGGGITDYSLKESQSQWKRLWALDNSAVGSCIPSFLKPFLSFNEMMPFSSHHHYRNDGGGGGGGSSNGSNRNSSRSCGGGSTNKDHSGLLSGSSGGGGGIIEPWLNSSPYKNPLLEVLISVLFEGKAFVLGELSVSM